MRRVQYRRWSPSASPLRVEISEELLQSLRPRPKVLETQGGLYGSRHSSEIRILGTAPEAGEAVGIFVCRERGEVFLTEPNLASMLSADVPVALVIAGNRAGFFVRESDGTIQTVRSHEEFTILEPPPQQPLPAGAPEKAADTKARRWNSITALWAVLLALPVAALAYFRPTLPQKPAAALLQLQDDAGQLHIQWRSDEPAILEIRDGGQRTAVPVLSNQSSATYQRRSGEVEVALIRAARRDSATFDGSPPPPIPAGPLRSDIARIQMQAARLREEATAQRARIASLQRAISLHVAPADKSGGSR